MTRAFAAIASLGILVACHDDGSCAPNDCATDASSDSAESMSECLGLNIDSSVSIVDTLSGDRSQRRCYTFELRENAVPVLLSESSSDAIDFTFYVDEGSHDFSGASPILDPYNGGFPAALPKGRYALVARSYYPLDYEFRLSAKYHPLPSPAQEPADSLEDRDEMVELTLGPSAEVEEYVGGHSVLDDPCDYYRFSLSESSEVSVDIDTIISSGLARAVIYTDESDPGELINAIEAQPSTWPKILAAGDYLVKVTGSGTL